MPDTIIDRLIAYHDRQAKIWPEDFEAFRGHAKFAADLRTLKAELRREVLGDVRVPTTVDGKPIVHEMTVYEPPIGMRAQVRYRPTATNVPWLCIGEVRDDIDPTECFSSKEAATASDKEIDEEANAIQKRLH